jgi:hypothetical protein
MIAAVESGADPDQQGLAFFTRVDTNTASDTVTERLRIDEQGRVGIGTTSPSAPLHVAGITRIGANDASDANLEIGAGATGNRNAYIDLVGDTTYTDFGARLIRGNTGANASTVLSHRGTGELSIQTTDAAPLTLYTTNAERARIDSSGRLLVGTSTALGIGSAVASDLEVETANVAASFVRNSADGAGAVVSLGKSKGTTPGSLTAVSTDDILGEIRFAGADGTTRLPLGASVQCRVDGTPGTNDMPGRLVFSTTADGAASPTERMRIDSAGTTTLTSAAATSPFIAKISTTEAARIDSFGRLLVGTSVSYPASVITEQVQLHSTSSGGSSIGLTTWSAASASTAPSLNFARSRGAIGTYTSVSSGDDLGLIRFSGSDGSDDINAALIRCQVDGTPGTDDMPGRLIFSTTADGASSPTERMRVNNAGRTFIVSTSDALALSTTLSAGTSNFILYGRYGGTAGSSDSGTASFGVYTNGNVVNTNNSYGALSDAKLKENIVDANSQWDNLKALQVRNYNLKEGQTHRQIGLIAQEVELVSPGLVSESPDRDEDGNDLGTVTKSVNYSVLYMKAVKALQEAMERIESLEAKVAALEAS